jgi:hypothetical protein
MKTAAAYLLAQLGGKAAPSAADIAAILGSGTYRELQMAHMDTVDESERRETAF